MTDLPAGRELDAVVAEKVMGWTDITWSHGHPVGTEPERSIRTAVPRYSEWIQYAWLVVQAVQRREPGWRFCLLGGDVEYGYIDGSPRKGVDRSQTLAFGWHAEYHGHVDPDQNFGQRHGESEYEPTPALAICRASLRACGARATHARADR